MGAKLEKCRNDGESKYHANREKKANRKEHTNHKKWHKEQGNIINIVAIWNAVLPALQRV